MKIDEEKRIREIILKQRNGMKKEEKKLRNIG